jgi:hypothetical protein
MYVISNEHVDYIINGINEALACIEYDLIGVLSHMPDSIPLM